MRVMYGIPDSKLSTVYNGIDYEFRDPTTLSWDEIQALRRRHHLEDNYVGLYFGRMWLAKGMDDVLRSLVETIKLVPNYKQIFITPKKQQAKLLWVKNTFSVSEVEEFISKHQLGDHVIWLESLPIVQLKHWIGLADVVILPSRAEWFGFAVSEVCALNRPLITTSVASIPEVVYGKINFVEPSNEHDISQKVLDFYHNKYEIITEKKFEREKCIKDTSRLYQFIIKKWK
jgi:spore coat protein SA